MKYIVYDNNSSYGITQEQFDTQLFLGKTLYDLELEEMFMVGAEGLVSVGEKPFNPPIDFPGGEELIPGSDPEVPAGPEVEETPSEEEKTEN